MRADIPAGVDPKPRVPQVQQRVLCGPERARVLEHGGADPEEARVRRGLQLRAYGHGGSGAAQAGGRRRSARATGSARGRRADVDCRVVDSGGRRGDGDGDRAVAAAPTVAKHRTV